MSKQELSLDIWVINVPIKIKLTDGKEVSIPKKQFLFLLDRDGEYLIFKTEDGMTCKIHRTMELNKKITKVF